MCYSSSALTTFYLLFITLDGTTTAEYKSIDINLNITPTSITGAYIELQTSGSTVYHSVYIDGISQGYGTPEASYGLDSTTLPCYVPSMGFTWREERATMPNSSI